MTARARLLDLRRTLAIALTARALMIGASAAIAIITIVRLFGFPGWGGDALAALLGLAVAFRCRPERSEKPASTGFFGLSLVQVALWVEEQTPSLRYSLVTVADGLSSETLEQQALATPWWTDAAKRARKLLVTPAIALLAIIAISIAMPGARDVLSRTMTGSTNDERSAATENIDVLAAVQVTIVPPAYSRKQSSRLEEPTSVEALVGSAVTFTGRGDARQLTATADSLPRSVAARAGGWSLGLVMPARPAIVRLHSAAGRDRLIVLAPIADAIPAVTLLTPARDTIVRRATGTLPLHAQLRDDIALRDAAFELVISSGGGENFTFRSTTIGRTLFTARTEGTLSARVSLDSLQLKPGDILQLRAVARDGNTVSGVGVGASETRALRVARPDEYDSVAVDAAPPPEVEGQVLSQRMLIILTEALVRKQRSLARPDFIAEANRIALDQRRLRKRVGDIVFQRMGDEPLGEEGDIDVAERGKLTPEQVLAMADSATGAASGTELEHEGDETPILAVNKPLLEAFNHMWDAGRALEVGEPAKALPPMRRALAAIERARQAERIYLRGRPSNVIVDIGKVRLSGKDKGIAGVRERRAVTDPVAKRRAATFERVTGLIASNPDAAADSLLIMRVEALGNSPALAAALDQAARALRKRDSDAIGLAWAQVRRTLTGAPVQRTGVSSWTGGMR